MTKTPPWAEGAAWRKIHTRLVFDGAMPLLSLPPPSPLLILPDLSHVITPGKVSFSDSSSTT